MKKKSASTTTFTKVPSTNPAFDEKGPVFEWYWTTKGVNGERLGGSQGEGYKNLLGAINGFFAQQGFSDWRPSYNPGGLPHNVTELVTPDGYSEVVKVDANTYTIQKYKADAEPSANTEKEV